MKKLSLLTSEFPPFRGGIGVLADQLAVAATGLGAEVEVIAPDYLTADHHEFDAQCAYAVRRYRAGPYAGKRMPQYLRQAIRAGRDPGAGKLIAIDSPFLEALALTRPLHRKPFVSVLHGSEINRASQSRIRRAIGVRRIFGAPERFVANSNFTRALLLDKMPFIAPDRVVMAYPAANDRWFSVPDLSLLGDLFTPDAGALIVCTGRITPRKGQATLLRALRCAPLDDHTRKGLTVVIAGRAADADRAYLDELRREADLARPINTIIRGDLDDDTLRALYSVADVFCLPGSATTSAVEGFGLVFVEAAAQGLPSVAGAVGAAPETVINDKTGVLVPPDDPAALGQAIAALLADRGRLTAMKTVAREHASGFSWAAFAKPFLEMA